MPPRPVTGEAAAQVAQQAGQAGEEEGSAPLIDTIGAHDARAPNYYERRGAGRSLGFRLTREALGSTRRLGIAALHRQPDSA
jgi:hypothetical protein